MKKKNIILLSLASAASIAAVSVLCLNATGRFSFLSKATGDASKISISSLSGATNLDDNPYWKQLNVRNNLFDFLGASEENNGFTISQRAYGADGLVYKGLVYNRSIINGFSTFSVTYSGSPLFVAFSEYLMEDMSFPEDAAHLVASSAIVNVDAKDGYFVLYTSGTTHISSLDITYTCDESLDASLLYTAEDTTVRYARSVPKKYSFNHDLIDIENNPTANTCNYSTGSMGDHAKSWYRWNGLDFGSEKVIGTEFSIHTTIIGNISYMTDSSKHFHYAVWPMFNQKSKNLSNEGWLMTYIGNDNYEPLGKDDPNRILKDAYADYSYAGRFYGVYDWIEADKTWAFVNPDETMTQDKSGKTLRQAYETFTLPFWHVEFQVKNNSYRILINGFCIEEYDGIFEDTNYVPGEALYVRRMDFHVVNYGTDLDTPDASYSGTFTTPRISVIA